MINVVDMWDDIEGAAHRVTRKPRSDCVGGYPVNEQKPTRIPA
jgi:hypothetical protein